MFTKAPHKLLLVSASSLICFLLTALLRDCLATFDACVNSWATSINGSFLKTPAEIVSFAFDTNTLLVLSIFTAAVFFYKRHIVEGGVLLGSMGGNALSVELAKMLVHSARPPNGLMVEAGYSFPSGHASAAIVYLGTLAYFTLLRLNSVKMKTLLKTLFAITVAFVGFDRIYLNSHWLSDFIGGYLLGTFWASSSILIMQHLKQHG
ncbi:MAG: phosphatase PAP2 family protein, partial [Candidatus Norongarragalinales archaeon]